MQSVKTGRSKWAHQNAIFIMRFTICGGSPTDRYFEALKRQILVVFLPICSNLKTGRRSAVSGRSYFNSIDNPSTSATKPMVFKAISPGRFGSGRAGPHIFSGRPFCHFCTHFKGKLCVRRPRIYLSFLIFSSII